jgi:hypothetical protein
MRALKMILACLLVFVFSTRHGMAFEQCPEGSVVCASVSQVVLYLLIPSMLILFAGFVIKTKLKSKGFILLTLTGLGLAWIIAMVVLVFALSAFLAPCSSHCWYKVL